MTTGNTTPPLEFLEFFDKSNPFNRLLHKKLCQTVSDTCTREYTNGYMGIMRSLYGLPLDLKAIKTQMSNQLIAESRMLPLFESFWRDFKGLLEPYLGQKRVFDQTVLFDILGIPSEKRTSFNYVVSESIGTIQLTLNQIEEQLKMHKGPLTDSQRDSLLNVSERLLGILEDSSKSQESGFEEYRGNTGME